MNKILIGVGSVVAGLVLFASPVFAANPGNGFNEFGYNNTARLFNGTLEQWCLKKGITDPVDCGVNGFGSVNDKLVMKWNAEWESPRRFGLCLALQNSLGASLRSRRKSTTKWRLLYLGTVRSGYGSRS